MKSRLLKNNYNTGWSHKIEKPISSRTRLRMMGASLLSTHVEDDAQKVTLDQSLIGYAVIFFSLGYLLNL